MSKAGIASPRAEAETLVRHFAKADRLDFFTGKTFLSAPQKKSVRQALEKRTAGAPLGYVLKEADFLGRPFFVNESVLIPRPETELLAEEALRRMRGVDRGSREPFEILDVGTGSGCLAVSLTLARPDCKMTAVDVSPKALRVARKNIHRYGLDEKITLAKSDLFQSFAREKKGFWDLIVSNPPYVPCEELRTLSREVRREPRIALDGGPKGLEVILRLLDEAADFLKKDGWLVMEIGDGQAALIRRSGVTKKYRQRVFTKDLLGVERIFTGQKKD